MICKHCKKKYYKKGYEPCCSLKCWSKEFEEQLMIPIKKDLKDVESEKE